ncbi:Lrp/AsnC family transcriptional regulator [Candidatus Woesearchaeota archaeon]|nr:Lrp/AsnC family transcriptional regulator [Candidatus Woesearchaeota archaeon]
MALEREGIIKESFTLYDYSYFGILLFRVYFKGAYVSEVEKSRIVKELSNNQFITSLYEFGGEFDLTAEFASPNPSRFNKELKKLSRLIPTLNDYKIVLNLVTYVCPKQYITKSEQLQLLNTEKIVGGDRDRETFSQNEMALIKTLYFNPKMRFSELSKMTKLNVKTVKNIHKNLSKRNIIRGCKYILDNEKLGIQKFRLFLRLHNVSPERDAQLIEYVLRTREAVNINKTVGDWDLEIDIEAQEKSRIRFIVMKLREEFKDLIETFNLIEYYNSYKRSYLPLYLFQEGGKES